MAGKKGDLLPTNVTIDQGNLIKRSDKKLGRRSSRRRFSDARQLGCVFQDMTPPKTILRKSINMQRAVQRENSRRLLRVTLKFETKILRSDTFAQVNLISEAPTLQNLRIGLRRRQKSARKASWKLAKSVLQFKKSVKEQLSSHLRKIGACLHQILNLRNEILWWTPVRQCI